MFNLEFMFHKRTRFSLRNSGNKLLASNAYMQNIAHQIHAKHITPDTYKTYHIRYMQNIAHQIHAKKHTRYIPDISHQIHTKLSTSDTYQT